MSDHFGIAVVDSGVNTPHPHLPAVAGGVAIAPDGSFGDDYVDRLGHGTAVAAAIHEKAPTAELYAVKVFDRKLATSVEALVLAIEWAADRGLRIVNLSLGTPDVARAPILAPAIERAHAAGTIVVSAASHADRRFFPGSMPGVVGVVMEQELSREEVRVTAVAGRPAVAASGLPRPIPGVPPERNLHGISFAVANATGLLAARLRDSDDVRSADAAIELLATPTP